MIAEQNDPHLNRMYSDITENRHMTTSDQYVPPLYVDTPKSANNQNSPIKQSSFATAYLRQSDMTGSDGFNLPPAFNKNTSFNQFQFGKHSSN